MKIFLPTLVVLPFVLCAVVITTVFPSLSAESARICTRERGARVTVRQGPGTDYERGLEMVGSGGATIVERFRRDNFTVADREEITVFTMTHGTDGLIWYKVGTNQWVGWVRSDFVCRDVVNPGTTGN